MKNQKSAIKFLKNCTIDSKPVQIVKDNPVVTGVTATYVTGATVMKVAAGHTVAVSLAHTLGFVLTIGAAIYGGKKLIEYMESKDATNEA